MLLIVFHIYQAAIIKPKIFKFASIVMKINQIIFRPKNGGAS